MRLRRAVRRLILLLRLRRPRPAADDEHEPAKSKAKPPVLKIGIIGTAGRKEDKGKVRYGDALWIKMLTEVRRQIAGLASTYQGSWEDPRSIVLVSGASAVADHLAVDLAKEYGGLEMYLPCGISREGQFELLAGQSTSRPDPAWVLNQLHAQFSGNASRQQLAGLVRQKEEESKGQVPTVRISYNRDGFLARNTQIAAAATHGLIALTWGASKDVIPDGGTADTWRKSRLPPALKVHIPLGSLA